MSHGQVIAFLGPSLPAREVASREVQVRAPARKGDVLAALTERPVAIALVDGVFEASPSVWHRELLAALESGVAVFGGASMGALRAAELDADGMIGVGEIYRGYRDGALVDDSEVALLHAPAELQFRPLTVPLVNVRHVVRVARRERVLSAKDADALLAVAQACFYVERTWPELLSRVRWSAAVRARWSAHAAGGLEDLKALDARSCIDAAVAYVRSGARLPPRPASAESSWLRWLGLAPGGSSPSAEGDAVLARKALAALARGFGLDSVAPPPAFAGLPRERARMAEAHLSRAALDAALRLFPDGPSRAEAEASAKDEAQRGAASRSGTRPKRPRRPAPKSST